MDYRNHTKTNPRYKTQFVGRDGEMVEEPLERPLTMEGFRNYARNNVGCVQDYFANTNDAYPEYSNICRAIMEEVRQDQIEGGMVGQYNPSITQRLNGLVERTQVEVKEQPLFPEE